MAHSDLVAYFTLGLDDLRWVRSHRGAPNRLGLAVQLCALPFLGFIPEDLRRTPPEVVARLAERVSVAPGALDRYSREVDVARSTPHTPPATAGSRALPAVSALSEDRFLLPGHFTPKLFGSGSRRKRNATATARRDAVRGD